jgi:hypothetical protein
LVHRSILNKKAVAHIYDNINNNISSSTVKNFFLLPPDYKNSMDKEITVFLSNSIEEIRKLIGNIKKNAGI